MAVGVKPRFPALPEQPLLQALGSIRPVARLLRSPFARRRALRSVERLASALAFEIRRRICVPASGFLPVG